MLEPFRSDFNARFTEAKYAELLRRLDQESGTHVTFRVAETPCFFAAELMSEMVAAGADLTRQLVHDADYLARSDAAIPAGFRVRGQDRHPNFMTADFGLVRTADGELKPKLVELQAFPSIFGYQPLLAQQYREVFGISGDLSYMFGGLDEAAYWQNMRDVILGRHDPENVVLLELDPEEQKTYPDFLLHAKHLGIQIVNIRDVEKQGTRLLYWAQGRSVPIHRIYNRVIVDELQRMEVQLPFNYDDELDVEWAGHPNWYFRISKYSLPYLRHETVPPAVYLSDYFAGGGADALPTDRDRWVLKPLYSFAGKGIQFAPSDEDLRSIPPHERANYLLQERVSFEPVIRTPEGMTQAEIRILYLWPDAGELTAMTSLVRMGRGLMMGVDHNRDRTWVGGSAGFFPKLPSAKQGRS